MNITLSAEIYASMTEWKQKHRGLDPAFIIMHPDTLEDILSAVTESPYNVALPVPLQETRVLGVPARFDRSMVRGAYRLVAD